VKLHGDLHVKQVFLRPSTEHPDFWVCPLCREFWVDAGLYVRHLESDHHHYAADWKKLERSRALPIPRALDEA
jgi:Zn-finger nucleic acid-binding protein